MSSLKLGILANMAGQFYSVGIGVVMVPAYVHYMGMEAYGLLSFFVALQAWFALLDAGISPTLIRQMSRFRAGEVDASELMGFVRSAEALFSVLGVVCCVLILAVRTLVAEHWFRLSDITTGQASLCVGLMGVMLGCRWLSGFYRSGLIGAERFPLVNAAQVGLSTLRSVIVLIVLAWVSDDVRVFFAYQTALALTELALFRWLFRRALPEGKYGHATFEALRSVVRFAGSLALLTLVWGVLAQMDRLILSHFIDMAAFGEYSLAAVAASAVAILATPFTQALQPRLVYVAASGDEKGLEALYRTGTQTLVLILGVVAGAAIFMGDRVIWVWVGDAAVARRSATLLALYAAGHFFWALSSLVFQLQYVRGNVQRHLVGTLWLAVFWVPAIVLLVMTRGQQGAAWAWFCGNAAFFFFWMLGTQRRMMPGHTWRWLFNDAALVPLCCAAAYAALDALLPPAGRFATLVWLGGAAAVAFCSGLAAGSLLRPMTGRIIGPVRARLFS